MARGGSKKKSKLKKAPEFEYAKSYDLKKPLRFVEPHTLKLLIEHTDAINAAVIAKRSFDMSITEIMQHALRLFCEDNQNFIDFLKFEIRKENQKMKDLFFDTTVNDDLARIRALKLSGFLKYQDDEIEGFNISTEILNEIDEEKNV